MNNYRGYNLQAMGNEASAGRGSDLFKRFESQRTDIGEMEFSKKKSTTSSINV